MSAELEILKLLGLAYDAALDPRAWTAFLHELARLFQGGTALFSQDMRSAEAGIAEFAEFDPAWLSSYVQHYSARNIWLATAARDPAGTLVVAEERVDRRTLERSEFYNDWLRPQGLATTCGSILLKNGEVLTNLAVLRGNRPGSFSAHELKVWQTVVPHVQRAVQVHRELWSLQTRREGALEALNALRIGVMLAAADARILFSNVTAENILSAGAVLSVAAGKLVSRDAHHTAQLQQAIAGAALTGIGRSRVSGGVLAVSDGAGHNWPILVCPLKADSNPFGVHEPAALLLVSPEPAKRNISPADLKTLLGFSDAEARLAAAIAGGQTLEAYAASVGITIATARTQLKSVFTRADVRSQPDLTRLILSAPPRLADDEPR